MSQDFATISRRCKSRSRWAHIAEGIAEDPEYLCVGDQVSFTLKDGRNVVFDVAAVNPYEENTIALVARDCLFEHRMNERDTNRGGYPASEMRKFLLEEVLPLFPDDLVKYMKPRRIVQTNNGDTFTCEDKLWICSHTEMFGNAYPTDVDDVQFELFKDRRNRMKYFNGELIPQWERSPYYSSSNFFCSVYTNGNADYTTAYYSYGVAPAFLISEN